VNAISNVHATSSTTTRLLRKSASIQTKPVKLSFPTSTTTYPREIVFLGGAPGAGKGANSSHIAKLRRFSAPTIVVSDLLNTPACKLLKDHGIMVDDDFVFDALLSELQKPIYNNGVVVDGFPRTSRQVLLLTKFYNDQAAASSFLAPPPRVLFVMLHVDESLSIARQQDRGRQIALQNETHEIDGKPLIEVRQTDLDIQASKARYQAFKEQYEAVMSLGERFPLLVVDASEDLDAVQVNLTNQITSIPSVLL